MADISYTQKEDLADTDEAMEAEGGGEVWGSSAGEGDESRVHFQLTRLRQHANSETTFNRQMVGHILLEIFRSAANTETKLPVEEFMKYVHQICNDPEASVRSDLVEQLPYVAIICQEAPNLFGDVLHDHLLGIIKKYLLDSDSQVRQTAQDALLALIKRGLLDTKTIETEICPIVESLSCMTVEYLNSGISLMSKMALLIGKELTEKVFLDRYIALCGDDVFHTRRICASHFGEICAAVGRKALIYKLFPIFVHLCLDTVWGVRKACVDVMMPVSCCVSYPYRRILLADILATHLDDDSKWVRMSAFQILGPFISTFAKQFTNVTYNRDGELVFTSQQEGHVGNDKNSNGTKCDVTSSIRFPYETVYPMKNTMQNEAMESENYDIRDMFDIGSLMEVYENIQKNYMSNLPLGTHTTKSRKKRQSESDTEDAHKFNTFLYYHITPELPVDDPLVQAVQKAYEKNKKTEEDSPDNKKEGGETNEGSNDSRSSDGVEGAEEKSSSNTTDNRNGESKKQQRDVDEEDDEDDGSRSSIWTDDSAETIDISNLSFDKSNLNASLLLRKYESKNAKQDIVPQDLVDYFVSMTEPQRCGDLANELPYHCAFSFPAVAFTLGKENWPYLKKAYQSLASACQWKVRRTLASSIHEIAIILGEELTATDLVPIYDGFIKDLDEVRIGVLKHLATFLKILKPTDRLHYLPRLNDFLATDNEWNWRFRKELASQLLEAVTLFSANDVAKHIASLSLQLLTDKVAAVRHVALTLVSRIVSHLSTDEALVTALIQELKEILAIETVKWIHRQTYALLCAQLITNGAISGEKFAKEMLPNLLNLSWDKVPNVRLVVARTLLQNVVGMGNWMGYEHAETVGRRLTQMRLDIDRDVRILAGGKEHLVSDVQTEQARNIIF